MTEQADHLFDANPLPPGDHVRALLSEKAWTQEEFAAIIGRSRQQIHDIISGRRGITAEMAIVLAGASNKTPDYWMRLDAAYRLSLVNNDSTDVQARAKLFDIAPVKDMQRRGWIKNAKDLTDLDGELRKFFGVDSFEVPPEFPVSMRKTAPLTDLTPSQRAWCFRARQLAEAIQVQPFDHAKLDQCQHELRQIAAFPAEAKRVAHIFQKYNMRFVVVEPLPGSKIDGAAFWIDDSPVVAVSVRFDRIDAFWFTVMHEFAHIKHKDGLSVDTDLAGSDQSPPLMKDEVERRADEVAQSSLIAPADLESFVRRYGPLYPKKWIIQFAHRIKIHPGIIVGQLQHRGEIGYSANREMLAKVRDHVVSAALTDGWGQTPSPNIF